MLNISVMSFLFLKISLIQSISCNFFLIYCYLFYILDLEDGFEVTKSLMITNWSKCSEIECVMLPNKVINSKLLKKMLLIRVFDLSVTLAGCKATVSLNCGLSLPMLISIKVMLKYPSKKKRLFCLFSFSKSGTKYFKLKSGIGILGYL